MAAADPDDADGDGMFGTVNYVGDGIGRGWKADTLIVHQSASALAEDIGIGTSLIPVGGATGCPTKARRSRVLRRGPAIPAGRDVEETEVIRGANLFTAPVGRLHTPTQRTGTTQYAELDNLLLILHRPAAPRHGARSRRQSARLRRIGQRMASHRVGHRACDTVNGHTPLLHMDEPGRSKRRSCGGEGSAHHRCSWRSAPRIELRCFDSREPQARGQFGPIADVTDTGALRPTGRGRRAVPCDRVECPWQ